MTAYRIHQITPTMIGDGRWGGGWAPVDPHGQADTGWPSAVTTPPPAAQAPALSPALSTPGPSPATPSPATPSPATPSPATPSMPDALAAQGGHRPARCPACGILPTCQHPRHARHILRHQ